MAEERVGIRELKTQFSRYLRRVKAGGTVIITERGKPVGRLVPVSPEPEHRLRELVETRVVAWDGQKLKPVTPTAQVHGECPVSDLLLEDRE